MTLQEYKVVDGGGHACLYKYKLDKSEDDNGSRAVFDDVDCFRSQG